MFATSCNEPESTSEILSPVQPEVEKVARVNSQFMEMTRAISLLIQEEEIRELLYSKISERFDGDWNVLFKDLMDIRLQDDKLFKDYLIKGLSTFSEGTNPQNRLEEIFTEHPDIQIVMPIRFEEWESNTYVPHTAYIPADYNEGSTETVFSIDSEGSIEYLDAVEEPDFPVLVLGLNERTDDAGNLLPDYDRSNKRSLEEEDATRGTCYKRTDGGMESIVQVYVESWMHGKCEWKVAIGPVKNIGHPITISFDSKKNEWTQVNAQIRRWWWNDFGNSLYFKWIEKDKCFIACGKQEISFTASGTIGGNEKGEGGVGISATYKLTIKKVDDDGGANYVHRKDLIWDHYSTGTLRWYDANSTCINYANQG